MGHRKKGIRKIPDAHIKETNVSELIQAVEGYRGESSLNADTAQKWGKWPFRVTLNVRKTYNQGRFYTNGAGSAFDE